MYYCELAPLFIVAGLNPHLSADDYSLVNAEIGSRVSTVLSIKYND
jgi:hypothetical protein